MQYGGMHLLPASGWVSVIIAAPALLIIEMAAVHHASPPGPSLPTTCGWPAWCNPIYWLR